MPARNPLGDAIGQGLLTNISAAVLYIPILILWIYKRKSLLFHIVFLLFYIYLYNLTALLFFPIPIDSYGIQHYRQMYHGPYFNIIPFKNIIRFIILPIRHHYELASSLKNVGGNILAFIPFGFFFPCIGKRFLKFKSMMRLSFLVPLSVELIQLIVSVSVRAIYKFADIDDVILNMAGVVIGYCLVRAFIRFSREKCGIDLCERIHRKMKISQSV